MACGNCLVGLTGLEQPNRVQEDAVVKVALFSLLALSIGMYLVAASGRQFR